MENIIYAKDLPKYEILDPYSAKERVIYKGESLIKEAEKMTHEDTSAEMRDAVMIEGIIW